MGSAHPGKFNFPSSQVCSCHIKSHRLYNSSCVEWSTAAKGFPTTTTPFSAGFCRGPSRAALEVQVERSMERFAFRRAQFGEPWPGHPRKKNNQEAIPWRVLSACRLVQWDCRANSSVLRVWHKDLTCMAHPSKRGFLLWGKKGKRGFREISFCRGNSRSPAVDLFRGHVS